MGSRQVKQGVTQNSQAYLQVHMKDMTHSQRRITDENGNQILTVTKWLRRHREKLKTLFAVS